MTDRLPVQAPGTSRLPSLARHLEPERLVKRHGDAISAFARRWMDADMVVFDLQRTDRGRDEARQELLACPSSEVIGMVQAEITTALAHPPARRATQAALAVMFDSRVRGPQNPEIYLEALVYDLVDEGFPPAVVVGACQTLRRESTFTPEIAEVIAACRSKLTSYRAVASLAGRLLDVRERIAEALRAADAAPPPPPRTSPRADAQPGDLDW